VAMLEGIGENFGLEGKPCEDPWRQNTLFHYARSIGLLAMQARTKYGAEPCLVWQGVRRHADIR